MLKNSNSDQKFNTNSKYLPQNAENISIQISKKATNITTKNSSLLKNSSMQSNCSQKSDKHIKNNISNIIKEVKEAEKRRKQQEDECCLMATCTLLLCCFILY